MKPEKRLHWTGYMLLNTILDLIVEACQYSYEDKQSIRLMATNEDENGRWQLDSLATFQAASFVSMFFNIREQKDAEALYAIANLNQWAHIVAEHLNATSDARITFLTSGSTGKAKQISKPLYALEQEARIWLRLNGDVRYVYSMVATHHIYGFIWATILPALCNVNVVDARQLPLSVIIQHNKSLIVTIADGLSMLQAIRHKMLSQCNVVISGSPCHHRHLKYAADIGVKRVIQIYGSTETGGVGWRDQCHTEYRLREDLMFIGTDIYQGESRLDIQDHLKVVSANSFVIEGRKDGMIQIKGRNVDIGEVRHKISQHPEIIDSAIKIKEHDEIKSIHVFIVPVRDALKDKLRYEIVTLCEQSVLAQNIVFGEKLPKNEMGKVADWSTS